MAASTIPVPSSATTDNYVLISSVTPTAAASTLTFTGISGYRKLMLRTYRPGLSATSTVTLTFNGDTGSNYAYQALSIVSTSGVNSVVLGTGANTGIPFASAASGGLEQNLIINDTNTTGVKTFSGFVIGGTAGNIVYPQFNGMYFASAAITSITYTVTTNTFLASGSVALYGVAA